MCTIKNLCLIRFEKQEDGYLNLAIETLSDDHTSIKVKTGDAIITTFKTKITIDKCKQIISQYGHNFILLDITEESDKIKICGTSVFKEKCLGFKSPEPVLIVSDDDKEKQIFDKIKGLGIESLTQEENEFMKTRF